MVCFNCEFVKTELDYVATCKKFSFEMLDMKKVPGFRNILEIIFIQAQCVRFSESYLHQAIFHFNKNPTHCF